MLLFHDAAGPQLVYRHDFLEINDLNPEARIRWRMTRAELFRLGWRCIVASLRRTP